MIISASRRTDIPSYYSEWFIDRLREGFALVRNPMNAHQVSRVSLSPDAVDCIAFWTKNPQPMLDQLDQLEGYDYYFQFTINPYGTELESNLPPREKLVDTFHKLADAIGNERVVWRYSPVLLSERYTEAYHEDFFGGLCNKLGGYTERCMLGFLDMYPKIKREMSKKGVQTLPDTSKLRLANSFAQSGRENGISVRCCSEQLDLQDAGVQEGKCIDGELIAKITGGADGWKKDRNQRPACGCVESVEIGAYDTCLNGCAYCYANYGSQAAGNYKEYDKNSPMLCGTLKETDVVKERKMTPAKRENLQIRMKGI